MFLNKDKVEQLLEQMKGKRYVYQNKPLLILSYEFEEDEVKVVTDDRLLLQNWASLYSTLKNEFKPLHLTNQEIKALTFADPPKPTAPAPAPAIPTVTALPVPPVSTLKHFPQLSEILMANIESVKADKGYVEQAQQVSLSARQLVDMAKAEIEAARLVMDYNQTLPPKA